MPTNSDSNSDFEARRLGVEAELGFEIRTGKLKWNKGRYSNTSQVGWDSDAKRWRNWQPGILVLSLAAIIIIWALTYVVGTALKSGTATQAEITEFAGPAPTRVSEEDKEEVLETLAKARIAADAFFSAETHEERVQYVRDSERVLPLVRKFYSSERIGDLRPLKFGTLMAYRFLLEESGSSIVFTWAILLDGSRRLVAVEENQEGEVRIDWECLVGYCAMEWGEFERSRPEGTHVFRVILSVDRHNPAGTEVDDAVFFLLQDVSRTYSLRGYVQKGTPSEKALTRQLQEFPEAFIVAELRFPINAENSDSVEIVNVRSMNWVDGFGPQQLFEPTQFLFLEMN